MAFSESTVIESAELARHFDVDLNRGLTEKKVADAQKRYGPNILAQSQNSAFKIFLRQFHSPFLYLLASAAIFSILVKEFLDAVMIVFFVCLNVILGFYQEYKSEKTVALLQHYVSAKANVKREGKNTRIPVEDIVPGDIVLLQAGDIVPADLRFISDSGIMIDESSLTGETVPTVKSSSRLKKVATDIPDAKNIAFAGTTVTSGNGTGLVIATGNQSFFGGISRFTTETKRVSDFEIQIQKISNFILRLILITLAFVLAINLFWQNEVHNILDLIIFAIALAVTVVPEALPVVTTFSLSRGSLHLAKHHVVIKRLSAIEDLGSIQVLCTDKTGTLTENIMGVEKIFPGQKFNERKALWVANMATPNTSAADFTRQNSFEAALWKKLTKTEQEKIKSLDTIKIIPFDPVRLYNTTVIKINSKYNIILRGAPEVILKHCVGLTPKTKKEMNLWIASEGELGRRVIAVAKKDLRLLPKSTTKNLETKMTFVGLISFNDPLKSTAKAAIQKAENLGIKVKILSGDSPEVVGALGCLVGLTKSCHEVITGAEIDTMSEENKLDAVEKNSVFARVSPAQKYTIIQLLQKKYAVGFVGDGINDAPSLKIAQVGLAVHDAADVAREAADIVLLKRSLHVIIDGIEEGRAVFANTLKYIKTTLAGSLGNFYTLSIATFLVNYLPMLPVQLLLVNLLTDFPMIAVATDNVDKNQVTRPQTYNIQRIALFTTTLGIISTVFDFVLFGLFSKSSPEILHTNWFIGSVLTEILLIFILRTRGPIWRARFPSTTMFGLAIVVATTTILLPMTTFGQNVFEFVSPTPRHLGIIAGILVLYVVANELIKTIYYRFTNKEDGI